MFGNAIKAALAFLAPALALPLKLMSGLWAKAKSTSLPVVAIGLLCVALGAQTARIEGVHVTFDVGPFKLPLVELNGFKGDLATADADLAKVKAAQAAATDAQAAVNHEPAARSAQIASLSDDQTPDYLHRVAVAAAGHAVPAGRLCGASPAEGGAQPALVPGTDQPAQGDDGEAGPADMVSVARADWDKLNREAGLRAQLYQLGQAWIAQGIAKADDAPDAAPSAGPVQP